MKEEDFDEKVKEVIEKLNQLHNDSNQTVGFVLLCGYDTGAKKGGDINFRVAGGGDAALLSLMMYVAAKDDERYSMIFNAAVRVREEKKEQEPVLLELRPTISRSFGK